MSDTIQAKNDRGEWVPAIPEPARPDCFSQGRKDWDVDRVMRVFRKEPERTIRSLLELAWDEGYETGCEVNH